MRRLIYASTIATALALAVPVTHGQMNQDADRVVPGGGVLVKDWKGKMVDASSIQQGRKIEDSKFAGTPDNITLNSGPGGIYWNPANVAKGDYTITATFNEPKIKSAMSHAHPYGIFIGGNDLDGTNYSLLYCSAYGTGTFIVRGFGPAPFSMGGRQPTANEAIHKAAEDGSVTQDIAMSVKGDKVSCSVNGTEVASYTKAELVAPGKLTSTDGTFGIRISHNTDVIIKNFKKQ